MSEQKPSVGRIVHYQAHGSPNGQHKSEPRAAIVTRVPYDNGKSSEENGALPSTIDLFVITPIGSFHNNDTPFSETPAAGCWNWPPRS